LQRAGVLAVLFACALALAGIAHAQKTVLPGYPSTPPPKQALPGNPTTPPPMRSPDMDGTLGSGSMDRGSQGPNIGSGTMQQRPGLSRDEARARFEQCLGQNTRNNTVNGPALSKCVAGWMPPPQLNVFSNCWNDPKTSAWECFGRAYN